MIGKMVVVIRNDNAIISKQIICIHTWHSAECIRNILYIENKCERAQGTGAEKRYQQNDDKSHKLCTPEIKTFNKTNG